MKLSCNGGLKKLSCYYMKILTDQKNCWYAAL
jgi:hypothetical protein